MSTPAPGTESDPLDPSSVDLLFREEPEDDEEDDDEEEDREGEEDDPNDDGYSE